MKKMFKSDKWKYLLGFSGLILIGLILPVSMLSSCSSTSNPFGPYTILTYSDNSTPSSSTTYATSSINPLDVSNTSLNIQYDTNSNTYMFYSDGNIINETGWVNLNTIKNYYYNISKQNVENAINNHSSDLVKFYLQQNSSESNGQTIIDSYKNLNFMYGVKPTQNQVNVANLYNKVATMATIYQYASSLANNFLTYAISVEFNTICNNLIGQNDFSVFRWSDAISNSNNNNIVYGKEMTLGLGLTVGEGKNVYHLWPSGFSCKINVSNTNNQSGGNNNDSTGNVYSATTDVLNGDINSPFPIIEYNNHEVPKFTQYPINVTDISVNYQWYKTKKNGGTYISSINDVNNSLTKQQSEFVNKVLGSQNKFSCSSFKLNLSDMSFNVVPEYYLYTDPLYNALYDYVYTGLYNIVPNVKYDGAIDFSTNNQSYPVQFQATVKDNKKVNWRTIIPGTGYSSSNIGEGVYQSISSILNSNGDKNSILPYYNSSITWASETNVNPYSIKIDANLSISPKYTYDINQLFSNPYVIFGDESNRSIANNHSAMQKQSFLNLWALGNMSVATNSNTPSTQNVNIDTYNEIKKELKYDNDKYTLNDFLTGIGSKYKGTYESGLHNFYSIIKINSINNGVVYSINQTSGQITSSPSLSRISYNRIKNEGN